MLAFSLFVGLFGCASVETKLPKPDIRLLAQESSTQEQQAFVRYLDMLERLDRVSAQVLQANSDLCEKTASDIGAIMHSEKSYPKHLRSAAQRHIGATSKPSILMVRKDSPASRAGLKAGDVLVDEKGDPVSFGAKQSVKEFEQTGKVRRRASNAEGYETLNLELSLIHI